MTEKAYRQKRAREWRERAIKNINTIIKSKSVDEDSVVVRDTIANLMHWCDEKDIDFEYELVVARDFFEAEKEGIE